MPVEAVVDFLDRPGLPTVSRAKCSRKGIRRFAAAEEAGAMTRRERRHLVEKEQFAPSRSAVSSIAPPYISPPGIPFQRADDPALRRPLPAKRCAPVRIVDDAAVSRETAAGGNGMQPSIGRDAIL